MTSKGGRDGADACFSGDRKSSSDLCDDARDWRRAWQIARGSWFQSAGLGNACRSASASTSPLTSITYFTLLAVARRRRGAGRVHVDVGRIGVVDHFQDGKSRRDPNHRTQLPGADALKGVFQQRGQCRKRHLAQEAARARSRIDRFCLRQRDEIFAAIQPGDDTLGLLSRLDDDDPQGDVIRRRDLCGSRPAADCVSSSGEIDAEAASAPRTHSAETVRGCSDLLTRLMRGLSAGVPDRCRTRWARRPATACGRADRPGTA